MSSLIGFRTGRGFPPPRGLITAASRYVTAVIQKNPPILLPPAGLIHRRPTPTSIFIKTQRPTAAIPLVPATGPLSPHPSSPSRFLRDVGAATRVGAATARTQNIDHRKKSHRIAVISRNRVLVSTRPRYFGVRRESSACGLDESRSPFIFPSPRPASCPRPTSGVDVARRTRGSHAVSRPYFAQLYGALRAQFVVSPRV